MKQNGSLIDNDVQIEQYITNEIDTKTFFVRSEGESALIDPTFEPELYDQLIQETDTELKYIFMTNIPLRNLSNFEEIARNTGAKVIFGENSRIFSNKNNSEFKLGQVIIKLISTPGYTDHSTSFLIINSQGKQRALFTGYLTPLHSICTPIIATDEDIQKRVKVLFDSIQTIKSIDKDAFLFPGFFKDNNIKNVHLSEELQNNKFFQCDSFEEFEKLISCQKETENNKEILKINSENLSTNYLEIYRKIKKFSLKEIEEEVKKDKESKLYIIDTRNIEVSSQCFIKNSVIMPLNVMYYKLIPCLMKRENKFIFVCSANKEEESILPFFRFGFINILGYAYLSEGDIQSSSLGNDKIIFESNDKEHIKELQDSIETIIDLREVPEYKATGIIPHSICIPLTQLRDSLEKIVNGNIHAMCRSGVRARIAVSFLRRNGFDKKMTVIKGDVLKLKESGFEFIKYE